MPVDLRISTGNATPIYRQICEQVCHGVASGALQPGEQLPSVRALAQTLVVNPNTVARAYNDLVRDGVAEGQPGRGVFVARRRTVYTRAERLRRLEPALAAFINDAVVLDFTPDEIRDLLDRKLLQIARAGRRPIADSTDTSTGGDHGRV